MEKFVAVMYAGWLHLPGLVMLYLVDESWATASAAVFLVGAMWGLAKHRKTFTARTLIQGGRSPHEVKVQHAAPRRAA